MTLFDIHVSRKWATNIYNRNYSETKWKKIDKVTLKCNRTLKRLRVDNKEQVHYIKDEDDNPLTSDDLLIEKWYGHCKTELDDWKQDINGEMRKEGSILESNKRDEKIKDDITIH